MSSLAAVSRSAVVGLVAGGGAAGPESPVGEGRRRVTVAALAFVLVVAAAGATLGYALSLPHFLFGNTEYDDGVYLGAAVALVHGLLPYRDFVFVQPPGSTLLLTPPALISLAAGTRDAMMAARLLTAGVEVANVALVGWLLRRHGAAAVLVGGGFLVAYRASLFAAHTVLLEPYLDLFCLVGVVLALGGDEGLASSPRLALAGAAFGFAGAVKLWAVAPFLVLVLVVVARGGGWRRLGALVGGTAVGFAGPVLPFLVSAPGAMIRQVLLAQAVRPTTTRSGPGLRLMGLSGMSGGPFHATVTDAVAAVLAYGALIGLGLLLRRGRRSPLEVFAPLAAVAVAVLLFLPAEWYYHYPAFEGPFLALSLGLAVGAVAKTGRSGLLVAGAVALAAVASFGIGTLHSERMLGRRFAFGDRGRSLEALIPRSACAVADAASLLVESNRFLDSRAPCPLVLDPSGLFLAEESAHGLPAARRLDSAQWLAAFGRADYLVAIQPGPAGRIAWSPGLRRYFARDFCEVRPYLYVRRSYLTRHLAARDGPLAMACYLSRTGDRRA